MAPPGSPTMAAREAAVVAALDALVRAGEDLAGRAQRLAPIEEGTLRGSVTVVPIVDRARYEGGDGLAQAKAAARAGVRAGRAPTLDVEVAFNAVYAAYQHEELTLEHPLGGQPKYLEEPLNANADRYGRIVALAAARGIDHAR